MTGHFANEELLDVALAPYHDHAVLRPSYRGPTFGDRRCAPIEPENPATSFMKTPEQTTAEVFPRYLGGEVLADSATLKWSGLFARRYRFARVVDGFLVPGYGGATDHVPVKRLGRVPGT